MADRVLDKALAPELQAEWREFVSLVEHRLEEGAVEYGDATLRRPVLEVMDEVEEELLDVMGWSFFAWLRIRRLKDKVTSVSSVEPKKALTEISQGDGR